MPPRIQTWLIVWAGWTALAVFLAVSASLTYYSVGQSANWSLSLKRSLAEWWLWALLTPAVAWLAARWPLHGARRLRRGLSHLAVGTIVAIGKTIVDRVIFGWLFGVWPYLLFSTIALQLCVYLAIVAAAHMVEYLPAEPRARPARSAACRGASPVAEHAAAAAFPFQHAQHHR